MTSSLHSILVIGAAFGTGLGSFGRRYNHLFDQARTIPAMRAQGLTPLAERALAKARAKRERRQAKLRILHERNQKAASSEWPDWDCAEKWAWEYRNQCWLKQTMLARVRGLVRPRLYRDILRYLKESGITHSYAVVRDHGGKAQHDDYGFGWYYLKEHVSGGYTGDDYAGEIWIPLNAGYFFHFHYSM